MLLIRVVFSSNLFPPGLAYKMAEKMLPIHLENLPMKAKCMCLLFKDVAQSIGSHHEG